MAKKVIAIQAGHALPQQPGHEGQTGAAGEVQVNIAVRDRLCKLLAADARFKAVGLPAKIPLNFKCDAYIALHCDGSGNPSAKGFSLGYPIHAVNKKLADCIRAEYRSLLGHPEQHAKDNYTKDMAYYYGYAHVDTPGPEALFEMGFVSNVQEHAWLLKNQDAIALALYKAILRFYGWQRQQKKVVYPFVEMIHDKDGTWHNSPSFGTLFPQRVAMMLRGRYQEVRLIRRKTVVLT